MPRLKREPFPKLLARLRKSKGLTQQELSDRSGVSRRMIAYFETRVVNLPPKSLIALSKALEISTDELIGTKSSAQKEFIQNRKLVKKMKAVDALPLKDQKAVLEYIDLRLAKRKKI